MVPVFLAFFLFIFGHNLLFPFSMAIWVTALLAMMAGILRLLARPGWIESSRAKQAVSMASYGHEGELRGT